VHAVSRAAATTASPSAGTTALYGPPIADRIQLMVMCFMGSLYGSRSALPVPDRTDAPVAPALLSP
jgi:hypothetical protein